MGWWQSITGAVGGVIGQAGGVIGAAIGTIVCPGAGTAIGGAIGGAVQNMAGGGEITAEPAPGGVTYTVTPPPVAEPEKKGCFVATEVYGSRPPQKFYDFRDRLPSALVKGYYIISPCLIPFIRLTHSQKPLRLFLNWIVR